MNEFAGLHLGDGCLSPVDSGLLYLVPTDLDPTPELVPKRKQNPGLPDLAPPRILSHMPGLCCPIILPLTIGLQTNFTKRNGKPLTGGVDAN